MRIKGRVSRLRQRCWFCTFCWKPASWTVTGFDGRRLTSHRVCEAHIPPGMDEAETLPTPKMD